MGIVEELQEAVAKRVDELEKKAKELQKKKEKFWKKHKVENHYARELMWDQHARGRDDLIETIQEGLLNRKMRRQASKVKEYKPQRMSKADCIRFMMFEKKMGSYDPNNSK